MTDRPELRYGSGLADERESWPVLDSSTVHETGRVISVRRDHVSPPNGGETFTRDVVVHPGAVGVVALDRDDRMLLVRQRESRLPVEEPAVTKKAAAGKTTVKAR